MAESYMNILKKPMTVVADSPTVWFPLNTTGYTDWIKKNLKPSVVKNKDISTAGDMELFTHQEFVVKYMNWTSPYRGVLLYHSLGSGKTITSVAVTEGLIEHYKPIVILPKYLTNNFKQNLKIYAKNKYGTDHYWVFFPKETLRENDNLLISDKTITKHKGIWAPVQGSPPNFNRLTDADRKQINKQINEIIETQYQFISYDGLGSKTLMAKIQKKNFFEGKVVIIDEVHNFISNVSNDSTATSIYTAMLYAENIKIICLSGTPIINKPFELVLLVNLLKGPVNHFNLDLDERASKVKEPEKIKKFLDAQGNVDTVRMDPSGKKAVVSFYGHGFKRIGNDGDPSVTRHFYFPAEVLVKTLIDSALREGIVFKSGAKMNAVFPLPFDPESFNDKYIKESSKTRTETLIKKRELASKLLGTISYVEAMDPSIYPTRIDLQEVKLEMSSYQLTKYMEIRKVERKREILAASRKDDNSPSTHYKSASRAACNFVFPESVVRPRPNDVRALAKSDIESDSIFGNSGSDKTEVSSNKDYQNNIRLALGQLVESGVLDRDTLHQYSPKFSKVLENLDNSEGIGLVYSQFMSVEGITIFSLVLEKNGYTRLTVSKNTKGVWKFNVDEKTAKNKKFIVFDSSDQEKTAILINLFNNEIKELPPNLQKQAMEMNSIPDDHDNANGSIVKAFLITKSGSEGISLRNVRNVHIIEPYWNYTRVLQTIGRAVRAHSHSDLPKEKQTVTPYVYVMEFSKTQLKQKGELLSSDRGMTTDQSLFDIAKRKHHIITQINSL
jgi:hypothetical protein